MPIGTVSHTVHTLAKVEPITAWVITMATQVQINNKFSSTIQGIVQFHTNIIFDGDDMYLNFGSGLDVLKDYRNNTEWEYSIFQFFYGLNEVVEEN